MLHSILSTHCDTITNTNSNISDLIMKLIEEVVLSKDSHGENPFHSALGH